MGQKRQPSAASHPGTSVLTSVTGVSGRGDEERGGEGSELPGGLSKALAVSGEGEEVAEAEAQEVDADTVPGLRVQDHVLLPHPPITIPSHSSSVSTVPYRGFQSPTLSIWKPCQGGKL